MNFFDESENEMKMLKIKVTGDKNVKTVNGIYLHYNSSSLCQTEAFLNDPHITKHICTAEMQTYLDICPPSTM